MIYTLEKVYTCSVQSTLSQKSKQNKQTDKCALGNFFVSYQLPTDHCRVRTLNNQIIKYIIM